MSFTTNETEQALSIPLNWRVEYKDGSAMNEYEDCDNKNDFYSIKQDEVARFGLFNSQTKMFYENNTGTFILDGKRLEVLYEFEDGRRILLTAADDSRRIITYKDAYVNVSDRHEGTAIGSVSAVTFGYNSKVDDMYLKFIIKQGIEYDERSLLIRIVSDEKMNGKLIVRKGCNVIYEEPAPIEPDCAGIIELDL